MYVGLDDSERSPPRTSQQSPSNMSVDIILSGYMQCLEELKSSFSSYKDLCPRTLGTSIQKRLASEVDGYELEKKDESIRLRVKFEGSYPARVWIEPGGEWRKGKGFRDARFYLYCDSPALCIQFPWLRGEEVCHLLIPSPPQVLPAY